MIEPLRLRSRSEKWLLALSFSLFAVLTAAGACPNGPAKEWELMGYDCSAYLVANTSVKHLVVSLADVWGHARHSFYFVLLAPVTAVGMLLRVLGGMYYAQIFIGLFQSLIMACCLLLVYRLLTEVVGLRKGGALRLTALFGSFGHVLLLSYISETFSISMLLLLLTLYATTRPDWEGKPLSPPAPPRAHVHGLLFFLVTGVTVTNGLKSALAYAATSVSWGKWVRWLAVSGACFVAILALSHVLATVAVEAAGIEVSPPALSIRQAFSHNVSQWHCSRGELNQYVWNNFLSEPLLLHDCRFMEYRIGQKLTYASAAYPAVVAGVYVLAAAGLVAGRKQRLLKVMLSFFAVDVFIHIVCRLGIIEGHIYAGHWFFILPLMTGFLLKSLQDRPLLFRLGCGLVLAMTGFLLAMNLRVILANSQVLS